ncbi:hypothetical protein ACHAWF_010028 [Thalassiosira exigua]
MSSSADTEALVVHRADDHDERPEAPPPSSSSAIVLDSLPYVEPLDPNYEQYAVSLIEEELQRAGAASGGGGEHPSLARLLPATASLGDVGGEGVRDDLASRPPDFGGTAPLAKAAYEALAARQAGDPDASPAPPPPLDASLPDPAAEDGARDADASTLLPNLRASVASAKILLERERLRLVGLELHRSLETPARYTSHASLLEGAYANPTAAATERRRRVVDGINAARMDEQSRVAGRLEGLERKRASLVEKNRRLGSALEGLEQDVARLREEAGA